VLEARERVGGRTWSIVTESGDVAELGGEWIRSDQTAVVELADRLGVGLVDVGVDFTDRVPVDGARPDPAEMARLVARVDGLLGRVDNDAVSAAEVLASFDSPARALLRARLEGSAGRPLSDVAASEIAGAFGVAAGRYLRCAGGNQELSIALACRLSDVRLSTPVRSIHGGDVTTESGESISADVVVVAVPLGVLVTLDLAPPLPPELRSLEMGWAAKQVVATADAPPLLARQQLVPPIWWWTGLGDGGMARRVVTAFAGTRESVLAVRGSWSLDRVVPEVETIGTPRVVDWSEDRWASGCYSSLGPGQRPLLEFFERPHGRMVFAGEHTEAGGTIDAAIRSGRQAAVRAETLVL